MWFTVHDLKRIVSFPPRRSQIETYSSSLSVDAGLHLLTSVTSAAAAAVTQVSSLQHPDQASPQLLILNIAQQGILTSDVKMSSYGPFLPFCRAAVKSAGAERVRLLSEAMGCRCENEARQHFETMEKGSAAFSREGERGK